MASVKGDIRLNDYMSRTLKLMNSALKSTIVEMKNLSKAIGSEVDTSGLDRISSKLITIDTEISNAVEEQEKFNKKVKETSSSYSGLGNVIKSVVGALGIKKLIGLSDTTTQITARLNLMTTGEKELKELENKIFASAQRSRAAYKDTADIVSKLGITAKKSFSSNDEIIHFAELMNKNFVVGGQDTVAQTAAMYQLTQAMASGRLQGDEYKSIIENAPLLASAIEEYMIKVEGAKGSMKEWAADGLLTANVIKAALFRTAGDVNKEFEKMPLTWGQVWISFSNIALKVLKPVLTGINWLANNLEIIGPIVLGLGGAFLVFQLAAHWTQICAVVTGVYHAVVGFLSLAFGMLTGNTAAASAAMFTFNSALLACPLTWVIMAVIIIIGLVYAVVGVINKVTGTTISATGIIFGAITWLGAAIGNIFIGLVNTIIGIGIEIWNLIAVFANFFANVFNDPVGSIINLFSGMFDFILGIVQAAAKLIDTVIGTNMAGAIEGFRNNVADKTAEIVGEQTVVMEKLNAVDYQLSGIDYGVAWDAGYKFGEGIDKKVSGMFGSDGLGLNLDNIDNVANVENVEGEVNVASEDLKLLRELAEQQYIQNYISNAPVQYITTGDIHENADIDYLIDGVRENLSEAINTSMEGVPVG